MRKGVLFFSALFLTVPVFALAATLGSGNEYSLGKNETVEDNLYVGSGNIAVAGNVAGDLVAAGGNVLVTGIVEGDVILAGGNVNLTGEVKDDVRIAGGQIVIGNDIAGDLAAAGGSVQVVKGIMIGKDAILAGGRVVIDGDVNGDLQIGAGEIVVNGKVAGNLTVIGTERLMIGKDAVIEGDLIYSSPVKADIVGGAAIKGATKFNQLEMGRKNIRGEVAGLLGFIGLMKFLSAIVLVSVLAIFFKRQMTDLSKTAMGNFGHELVGGLIVFLVVPVVSVILFVTFLGAAVGGVLLLAYVLLVVLAMFVNAVILGSWIAKILLKKQEIEVSWLNAALGVFLLSIVSFIPIFGWLFAFVFFLVAVGVLGEEFWKKIRN